MEIKSYEFLSEALNYDKLYKQDSIADNIKTSFSNLGVTPDTIKFDEEKVTKKIGKLFLYNKTKGKLKDIPFTGYIIENDTIYFYNKRQMVAEIKLNKKPLLPDIFYKSSNIMIPNGGKIRGTTYFRIDKAINF